MEFNVCIFDDSYKVIESVETLLKLVDGIRMTGSYNRPVDVVGQVKKAEAQLVIMDIDMPGTDGITAIQTLRKNGITVPVIIFTVFEDDDKIFRAICAGADGYLLKNVEPLKMIEAMKEAVNGGAPMSPVIARKVLQMFSGRKPVKSENQYELTARESEILTHLTRGLSYKMIAAECDISFETVRTHIKNIYSKLHVASSTEAVAKALNEKIV